MKFSKLKPGMIVYSVTRGKMGNTTMSTINVHACHVLETNGEKELVKYSWNGNPPRWAGRNVWSKWRENKPVTVTSIMGRQRLATREEIKSLKEETL